MKRLTKAFLTLTLVSGLILPIFSPTVKVEAASSGNDYPIVLCHGNGGWGRDEKSGYLYWGGTVDLEQELNNKGFEVYTGVVGPYSSNWDRACELYAYIKGGTVDYGKAHSDKFDHDRYGRTFPGLYPQWGEKDGADLEKIHLIGHSQGGPTVRLLVQLLEDGKQEELTAVLGDNPSQEQIQAAIDNGKLSPLFAGSCDDYVESVTTLASPNDGTTAGDIAAASGDFLGLFSTPINGTIMDAATGQLYDRITNFDLKLDQWSLTRKSGESFTNYFYRVMGSSMWKGTKDFSSYDLTTAGMKEMNSWVKDHENVYYFSYSCKATKKALLGYNQIPDSRYMNPLFAVNGIAMGAYLNPFKGIGSEWLPNDGYVNTISQDGPTLGRAYSNIVQYNGTPQIGKWNHMGLLSRTDHEDIIGRDTSTEMNGFVEFYVRHLNVLKGL